MAAPCASSDTPRGARLVTLRVPAEAERRRSRIARRRAAVLIGVHVLAAAHVAHWLVAGQTLAPLELNEVLHTLHLGVVTAGFLFMALAVLATALFGRFFCSWGCHLLALQDLSAWALEKLGVRPRPLRSRALLYVPLGAMLYLFVWPQVERVAAGRALPALHVASDADGWASFVTRDLWRNLPGPAIALVTFAVCGLVIVYVLGSRSFCRYACPYGAVFGLADRVAPGRIVRSGDCDACGLCTAVCQSHVRVHEEIRAGGAVVDPRCLKDLDCVAVCPKRALRYGRARPPLFASRPPPTAAPPRSLARRGRAARRRRAGVAARPARALRRGAVPPRAGGLRGGGSLGRAGRPHAAAPARARGARRSGPPLARDARRPRLRGGARPRARLPRALGRGALARGARRRRLGRDRRRPRAR
ncbi:MAG: 4Fe-4S binding protein [Sandaracinaceae bacterium]|nr:4Fe-4S binding protein [Sandaracinaceae bacterium]